MAVRSTMASMVASSSNWVIGIPATVENRGRGTMVSPCPPSTKAWVFSTETCSASAMNERMRAESSTPAMPTTRSRGKPLARYTT